MPQRYYYWIAVRDPDTGKLNLIFGSDRSEEEARQKAMEMVPGLDFEVKRYPTRSLQAASAFLRGKRLESGEGLKAAQERIGHEKSVKKIRQRRAQSNPGPAWD